MARGREDRTLFRLFGRNTPIIGRTSVPFGFRFLVPVGGADDEHALHGLSDDARSWSAPLGSGLLVHTGVRTAIIGTLPCFGLHWLALRCLRLRMVAFLSLVPRLLPIRSCAFRSFLFRWFGVRSLARCRYSLSGPSARPEKFHCALAFGLRSGGLRTHGLLILGPRCLGARALALRPLGLRALARARPFAIRSLPVPPFGLRSFAGALFCSPAFPGGLESPETG